MGSVEDRLARLEAENRTLRHRISRLEGAARVPDAGPEEGPATRAGETPSRHPQANRQSVHPLQDPAVPAPGALGHPSTPAFGGRDAGALEARIGTRWVALAGGVILIVALIVFLRLAFERGWIDPMARLVLGWTGGALLWGGGELLRRRLHHVYGQVVSGTGMGLAYVTTWVAFGLIDYQALTGMSDSVGTVVLIVLAAALALHAGLVRGPVLAGTALAGAHLVPLAGHDVQGMAMLGVALATVAVMATAAWHRWTWPVLAAQSIHVNLALGITFMDDPATAFAATLLVLAASTVAALRSPQSDLLVLVAWLLGPLTAVLAVSEWNPFPDAAGWLLLALAAAALGLVTLPRVRTGAAIAGITLAVLWPLVHLDAPWHGVAWGLQLITLAGVAQRLRGQVPTVATSVLAGLGLFWALTGVRGVPFDAPHLLAFCAVAVGSGLAYASTRRSGDRGIIALVAALGVPMLAAAAFREDPVVTLVWTLVAVGALAVGALVRDQTLRFGGLAVVPLVLIRVLFIDLEGVDALVRVLVFMAVGAILLGIGYAYARLLKRDPNDATGPGPEA